jgi:alpha-L-fucosidase 2
MKTLQVMLLQAEDRTIRLLPAWPAGWDADFKLHGPYRTVIQGSVRGGRLAALKVTPGSRGTDVFGGDR